MYKLDKIGRPYAVDMSGSRIFKFAGGRTTPRPPDIDAAFWELMTRKQKAECLLKRSPAFADTPPASDGRPGSSRDAGPPIVARAAQALAVATQDRDLIARMAEQGVVLETGGPEVLARTLAEELVMWGDLIRSQNIKPE